MSIRPAYFMGVVAYYETHINEIVEKYCVNKDVPQLKCNGQCHLAKQLTVAKNTDKNQDAIVDVVFAFYPVFYQDIHGSTFLEYTENYKKKNFLYSDSYEYIGIQSFFKPPIV